MRNTITKLLIPLICFFTSFTSWAQYYTSSEIDQIKINKSAAEGDLYLDTLNEAYYIGLTNGSLLYINFDSNDTKSLIRDNILTDVHLQPVSDTNTASQKSIKAYIDSVFEISGNETIFPIYAEESGNLNVSSTYQYSFGNGGTSANGLILPSTCTLFAVGLTVDAGSGEVTVYKNNTATTAKSGLALASASSGSLNTLSTPIEFENGDVINFKTSTANSASRGRAVAWFKVSNKIPKFARFNGNTTPATALGDDGDEYLNISDGNLYIKESGTWNLKLNLKGPAGSVSDRAFIQVTNTTTSNLNSGITQFTWINTGSGIASNDLTKYTVATDGITFTNGGTYKVTISQNQVAAATSLRTSSSLQLTIIGTGGTTLVGPRVANGYIRNSGDHTESTASLTYVVSVSSGQKLGFQNSQLTSTNISVTCPANGLVFLIEEM